MEYANIHTQHHHQLQEQINLGVQQSAASLPITTAGNCNWNPRQLILNNGTDVYPTEAIPNSRLWQYSPVTTSTFTSDHQDFNYGDDHHDHTRSSAIKPTANESPLPNIKEESNSPSYTAPDDNELYSNNYLAQNYSTISLNASFNPSTIINSSTSTTSRSTLSMLFPSLVLSSGGFNNSLEALDLLSPIAYNNSPHDRSAQSYSSPSSQHSNNSIGGLYGDQPMSQYGHHDMQESRSNNMTSAFFNEVTRSKRPSGFSEPKESHAEANKKSKSILRSSNPPLKVRKEKLGDRIAALHRLVAPFGKTDTASVLTEAIGYIQFLHDQVQTLSMPYLKSLQSKPARKMQQVHGMRKEEETELKMDLRSRGLCLVPQSCASYLNGFD